MTTESSKDLVTEAKNFSSSLANVFLLKKRDPQSKHLLEKAKALIDGLLADSNRTSSTSGTSRQSRSAGGMGQLWVKLDELKRENEDLKRHRGRSSDERSSPGKAQGPGEVIINDLHRCKADNESLKAQVEKLQKTVKDLQNINASLQDEYKRHKVGFDTAQKSVERVRQDYKSLEATLTSTKKENDNLKQKLTSSVKPIPRTDNRYSENISERCRPSTIAMKYDTMESQEWMDAKESLEDSSNMDEEDITKFLCEVLTKSYEVSQEIYSNLEVAIAELLKKPTLSKVVTQSSSSVEESTLPEEMVDVMRIRLRQIYESLDSGDFVEYTKHKLPREYRSQTSNKAVNRFMDESARITWQMVIQQPPMMIDIDDTRYNDEKHKLWWSCDKSKASNIDYFIWPVLYDYEHGNVLVKGCVSTR